jgi:hypothetical protein
MHQLKHDLPLQLQLISITADALLPIVAIAATFLSALSLSLMRLALADHFCIIGALAPWLPLLPIAGYE